MCRNSSHKVNLKDLTQSELKSFLKDIGEKPFRADQICQWIFVKGISSFDDMTNLSKDLRLKLDSVSYVNQNKVIARQQSSTGDTIKYLFGLSDGNAVESVLMKHSYGNSACVSTQVGCRMGCKFCASTISGLVRNLSPGEIYDQVLGIQNDTGERVSHIVIMGAGEPLDNYSNVLKFLEIINAEYGLNISYRHITLSTCGVVPRMRELALQKLPITLAVSLHAPNDELRNQLVPINRKYKIEELLQTCKYYIETTGRRITFEYALLSGVNDSQQLATELARLLSGLMCHINLIPVNTVEEREFKKSSPEQVESFRKILEKAGLNVTIRRELGTDIDAACGQLRRRYENKE